MRTRCAAEGGPSGQKQCRALAEAVRPHRDFLEAETLATSYGEESAGRGHAWEGELNGVKGRVEIERAS